VEHARNGVADIVSRPRRYDDGECCTPQTVSLLAISRQESQISTCALWQRTTAVQHWT
jgi:hypothetical protein